MAAVAVRASDGERTVLIVGMLVPLAIVVSVMSWILIRRPELSTNAHPQEDECSFEVAIITPQNNSIISQAHYEATGTIDDALPSGHYRVYCHSNGVLWPQGRIDMTPRSTLDLNRGTNWRCSLNLQAIEGEFSIWLVDLSEDLYVLDEFHSFINSRTTQQIPIAVSAVPPGMNILASADCTRKTEAETGA